MVSINQHIRTLNAFKSALKALEDIIHGDDFEQQADNYKLDIYQQWHKLIETWRMLDDAIEPIHDILKNK